MAPEKGWVGAGDPTPAVPPPSRRAKSACSPMPGPPSPTPHSVGSRGGGPEMAHSTSSQPLLSKMMGRKASVALSDLMHATRSLQDDEADNSSSNGRDRSAMAQRLSNEGQSAENAMAQQDDHMELASSEMKLQHPMDPHEPNFSELLPLPLRPYPCFEGWFIRILDPATKFSAAVILATNYATGESQVTLLFALGTNEIDDSLIKFGYTYAVAVKTKDAGFKRRRNCQRGVEPEGFEWEAKGIGRIVFAPHVTDIDFTVENYNFKAHLTKELLWDADHDSEKGPEGWARYVTMLPTHWYVYSLGSTVEYSFTNVEKKLHRRGSAFGHVEKNWGLTFPAGHVWLQAFSSDNKAQVCCAGAYFKTTIEKLRTPYIFVLGYRSPELQLDFRTNDLGVLFKDMKMAPLESSFSITAVGPSHIVKVKAYAAYETFSQPVLAPVTKVEWKPACRESYMATVEIQVYKNRAWGFQTLVESCKFDFAALEFGEDLLSEAEKSGNNGFLRSFFVNFFGQG